MYFILKVHLSGGFFNEIVFSTLLKNFIQNYHYKALQSMRWFWHLKTAFWASL